VYELVEDSVALVEVDVTEVDTVIVVVALVGTTVTTVCSMIGSILNPRSTRQNSVRRPQNSLILSANRISSTQKWMVVNVLDEDVLVLVVDVVVVTTDVVHAESMTVELVDV
jgi:hypothetical protein